MGKTIEAGIVLCQYWSEKKRKLLVICPASLRKQWALELEEKFNLPAIVLDAKTWKESLRRSEFPLNQKAILILSYNFANKIREEIKNVAWNLVVIDEAHKLRNAYRESNKIGQGIKFAIEDSRKLLLTATPLQNSLLELYGLTTLIDDNIFGDLNAFRSQFVNSADNFDDLRQRLSHFCRRTLRNQVSEYIRYTERRAITREFCPTNEEHELYEKVTAFLSRENSYSIPKRQKHLTELILRKLLASSSKAISGTFATMIGRLEELKKQNNNSNHNLYSELIAIDDIETDLLEEILEGEEEALPQDEIIKIDEKKLQQELNILAELTHLADNIKVDTKTKSLLSALETGFQQMETTGALKKALIFTESRRTQQYLSEYLQENGYAGQVVQFNGTNNSQETTAIYHKWLANNQNSGRVSGSKDIDIRTALIEHFRDHASILIATEAASEGVNIQFCSMVINYDLPWNPQRVEQRIGRCHRYGQKHDVVVINFLNERNEADKRVLELLTEKFNLFNGVFGASDSVLGSIESGLDFEKQILKIYQECRTTHEIDTAFQLLRKEMDERIQSRMLDTQKLLLENFDEDVHERLRVQLSDTKQLLDRFSKRFWLLTRFILNDFAEFNEEALHFDLVTSPSKDIHLGRYHLISKAKETPQSGFLYRLSHPLGEAVIENGKALITPLARLEFQVSKQQIRNHQIEQLQGKSGVLTLSMLAIESYEREEYLLFSGFDKEGHYLDQETFEKLFNCHAEDKGKVILSDKNTKKLDEAAKRHIEATISQSLETNNQYFSEAREKLEKWADDLILSSEKQLKDTKEKIKILERQARLATNLDEQHEIQQKIQVQEKLKRKQRREIFDVEDEIKERRDGLIAQLESRLSQKTEIKHLFTIEWQVV